MYLFKNYVDSYLEALEKEIDLIYQGEELETLYIGGGTPSSLEVEDLEKLFHILSKFKLKKNVEFTFECNIENTTLEKLQLLKKYGVNRLSFGVQTFNLKYLKFLNRYHSKEDVFSVINWASELGFANINVDIIYGIWGQTLDELKKDVDLFLELNVNHVSLYSLIIENNTILGNKGYTNVKEELEYEMYLYINNKLKENGFLHYEISNYAKEGYESKHNLNYWNNNYYYGFGLGAVSFIDNYRITNTKNINKYIKGDFRQNMEYEDLKVRISNEMILGLRKIEGVDNKIFLKKYGKNIEDVFNIDKLLKEGVVIYNNGFLKIALKYLYVSNEILLNFIDVL